ncbi:MAG: 4'-phosphopantetheinyl transferase superfamily protein [Betaproteobacteria bacterium]|nr:4'-phosphopantetheinyl transferase superfamily protein [Betaproteobacteria bacterium]
MQTKALHISALPIELSADKPVVLAVETSDTTLRPVARERVRQVLRALLAPNLGCSAEDVPLHCAPGSPPQLVVNRRKIHTLSTSPCRTTCTVCGSSSRLNSSAIHSTNSASEPRIGLGIAHEAGLSLVAAFPNGRVGVDLMRIDALPDWFSVARDYLGPDATRRLGRVDQAQRPTAFAAVWTQLEAVLKCHGLPLTEWSPHMAALLKSTPSQPLALPAPYIGHIAWLR